jgi:hypothetical protein
MHGMYNFKVETNVADIAEGNIRAREMRVSWFIVYLTALFLTQPI